MNKETKIELMAYFKALLIIVVLVAYGFYRFGVVATVNGQVVDRFSYWLNLEKQDGKQVLETMIQEKMILGEADKKGIKIDQKAIDEEISKIEEQLKEKNQTLAQVLESRAMTKADLLKQIRIQKIVEALAKPKTEVDQKEIDAFIEKNKAQFPKNTSKDDMQKMAKEQLIAQERETSIGTWFDNLKKESKVVYK
ncbi:SurA N-terminal domain-containing protein [Candidatus Shapirobacteria bacterium]|nr:SurA N-terminal domain-containing protein [Candidatus Shapirobacteria bacterium]